MGRLGALGNPLSEQEHLLCRVDYAVCLQAKEIHATSQVATVEHSLLAASGYLLVQ